MTWIPAEMARVLDRGRPPWSGHDADRGAGRSHHERRRPAGGADLAQPHRLHGRRRRRSHPAEAIGLGDERHQPARLDEAEQLRKPGPGPFGLPPAHPALPHGVVELLLVVDPMGHPVAADQHVQEEVDGNDGIVPHHLVVVLCPPALFALVVLAGLAESLPALPDDDRQHR